MKADLGEFVGRKYDVLLIDPPWSYYGSPTRWGAAKKFYPCMEDQEILSMPIRALMNEKSVAFVWATCPRLDFATQCIKSWGLHYRGVAFVWVKTAKAGKPIGAQGIQASVVKPTTELVLVASTKPKGRPLPIDDESVVQTVLAPKGAHSVKPDEIQNRIERLYPTAAKLELFARRKRIGWDSWGNEV